MTDGMPRDFNEYFAPFGTLDEVMLKWEGWPRAIHALEERYKALEDENEGLKQALRECLESIMRPDNGVSDVIWHSDHCTLAEFIAGELSEEIDFEQVAKEQAGIKVAYRCPKTTDFELKEMQTVAEEMAAALENIKNLEGEINPSNYDHEDVCFLNNAFIETYNIAQQALAAWNKLKGEG